MLARLFSRPQILNHVKVFSIGTLLAGYFLSMPFSIIQAAESYSPNINQTNRVPVNQSYDQFIQNIDETNKTGIPNTDSYIGAIVISRVTYGLLYMLTGDSLTSSADTSTNPGVLGFIGSVYGVIYANPPASGIVYVADMADKARLITPAYAQENQGFERLRPLLPFWSAMRNLAYVLYIPIFIYIGIMIMLRRKVGQAAVSIQQALPKIVLSLILVTFSFAIVGFLIDIMNLSMAILLQFFVSTGLLKADLFEEGANPYNTNFLSFATNFGNKDWGIFHIANGPGEAFGRLISEFLKDFLPMKEGIFKSIFGSLSSGIIEVLVTVVMIIAVCITLIKTLFTLVKAYIVIIAMLILGPLLLLIGALPNSKTTTYWLNNILANLAVFPAVLALFLFAIVIGNPADVSGIAVYNEDGTGWIAPFLGSFTSGDEPAKAIAALVSIGTFFLMPTALQKVQDFFKVKSPGGMFAPAQQAAGFVRDTLTGRGKDKTTQPAIARERDARARDTASDAYKLRS